MIFPPTEISTTSHAASCPGLMPTLDHAHCSLPAPLTIAQRSSRQSLHAPTQTRRLAPRPGHARPLIHSRRYAAPDGGNVDTHLIPGARTHRTTEDEPPLQAHPSAPTTSDASALPEVGHHPASRLLAHRGARILCKNHPHSSPRLWRKTHPVLLQPAPTPSLNLE